MNQIETGPNGRSDVLQRLCWWCDDGQPRRRLDYGVRFGKLTLREALVAAVWFMHRMYLFPSGKFVFAYAAKHGLSDRDAVVVARAFYRIAKSLDPYTFASFLVEPETLGQCMAWHDHKAPRLSYHGLSFDKAVTRAVAVGDIEDIRKLRPLALFKERRLLITMTNHSKRATDAVKFVIRRVGAENIGILQWTVSDVLALCKWPCLWANSLRHVYSRRAKFVRLCETVFRAKYYEYFHHVVVPTWTPFECARAIWRKDLGTQRQWTLWDLVGRMGLAHCMLTTKDEDHRKILGYLFQCGIIMRDHNVVRFVRGKMPSVTVGTSTTHECGRRSLLWERWVEDHLQIPNPLPWDWILGCRSEERECIIQYVLDHPEIKVVFPFGPWNSDHDSKVMYTALMYNGNIDTKADGVVDINGVPHSWCLEESHLSMYVDPEFNKSLYYGLLDSESMQKHLPVAAENRQYRPVGIHTLSMRLANCTDHEYCDLRALEKTAFASDHECQQLWVRFLETEIALEINTIDLEVCRRRAIRHMTTHPPKLSLFTPDTMIQHVHCVHDWSAAFDFMIKTSAPLSSVIAALEHSPAAADYFGKNKWLWIRVIMFCVGDGRRLLPFLGEDPKSVVFTAFERCTEEDSYYNNLSLVTINSYIGDDVTFQY